MALGDCFPSDLVNTTDLSITRYPLTNDYADETGSTTVVATGLSAIVVPVEERFVRELDSEEPALIARVLLDPLTAPAGIQQRDVVQWSDFYGSIVDAQVEEIERVSGVDGLEHLSLLVGRRQI